jgi:hypothetical protein
MRRPISVVWAYALVVAAFLGLAALRMPYGEGLRYPTLLFTRVAGADGTPAPLWQLDHERLRRSVQRISAVRLGRESGNSLRVAGGQVLEWMVWGGREPLMLFPDSELPSSRGLNAELAPVLDGAAGVIAAYQRALGREGWKVVILLVPTKLGIYAELCEWPVREPGLLSRAPLARDRSGEVYDYVLARLAKEGVTAVDLRAIYRKAAADPSSPLVYVPTDSHWSGEGIRLAAAGTARAIAASSAVRAREPVDPTYHEFDYVGDLGRAFDPLPAFTSRLSRVWTYRERLMNGERGRGYVYPAKTAQLVVAVGTSYSGQYSWLQQPVAFPSQLGLHLDNVEVQNHAAAGQGSFYAMKTFWEGRQAIAANFRARHGEIEEKVVVWEFPIRDIHNLSRAPLPR